MDPSCRQVPIDGIRRRMRPSQPEWPNNYAQAPNATEEPHGRNPRELHRRRAPRPQRWAHRGPDRPEHRGGVRAGPAVVGRRRRRRLPGRSAGVRDVARHDAGRAPARAHAHRRRVRGASRRAARRGGPEHGQAPRADRVGGDPSDGRPDPVLRRRGPLPRGARRRRVHGRPHLLHPARADRGVRAGHAVELPDDDGGLEVRPGPRGGQHHRPEAVRHHAGQHAPDGRDRGRVPPARRLQRRVR